MKYMGSKRFMLSNGLGKLLREQFKTAKRVVDPFCGAGSIVYFAAQNFDGEIIAGDLQKYATVLADAVIGRTEKIEPEYLQAQWLSVVERALNRSSNYKLARTLDAKEDVAQRVAASRKLCASKKVGPVWKAYGGYYYSPTQAMVIDKLMAALPKEKKLRSVCLAALITAAARCAASPGHTAQPFQPTKTAGRFIETAWNMDIFRSCKTALKELAPIHAKVVGEAFTSSAQKLVSELQEGDLVVVDPPYSGVQYSRFYHVLETIARGHCGKVSGVGRYPGLDERPQSAFSNAGQALKALEALLEGLAKKRATVIFTFPKGECSNGLSGNMVKKTAQKWFEIDKSSRVHGHFSTLGGNNRKKKNRKLKPARIKSEELLLLLKPRALQARM